MSKETGQELEGKKFFKSSELYPGWYRAPTTSFCLVHIPKTGGLGLRAYSDIPAIGHPTLRDLQREHGEKLSRMYKVAVFRDPWERLRSIQGYMASGGYYDEVPKTARDAARKKPRAFVALIEQLVASDDPTWLRPQVEFVIDDKGDIGVDEIVPYHQYEETIPEVMTHLGITYEGVKGQNGPGKRINRTPARWNVKSVPYTPEEKRVVRRLYADDIKLFELIKENGWKRLIDSVDFR